MGFSGFSSFWHFVCFCVLGTKLRTGVFFPILAWIGLRKHARIRYNHINKNKKFRPPPFDLKNDNWIFARNFGVNLHFRQVRIMTFSLKNIEKCFGLTDSMKKHISKICITFCRGWREQPKPWKRMDGSRTSSNCWLKPFRLSMAGKGKGVHLVILICVHVSKLNKFKNWHCGFFHL